MYIILQPLLLEPSAWDAVVHGSVQVLEAVI